MFQELFTASFKAGLPVGIAAYLLVWWALRNGYLGEAVTVKDVEKEVKRLARDKEKNKQGDPVHRKWLAMGGGFYGVMAMITLVYIEVNEVLDFLVGFEGLGALPELFSLGTLINLFIETVRNSFYAIAWPAFWLSDIRGEYIWVWFLAAYAGYWLGSNLATRHFREREKKSG